MSAEKDKAIVEALEKLDYEVSYDLEDCLSELYDRVFGLQSKSVSILNRTLKKFGYKVVKAS